MTDEETVTDDDWIHLYCCNPDIALCGLDISNLSFDSHGADCPMCAVVSDAKLPCAAPGCSYGVGGKMFARLARLLAPVDRRALALIGVVLTCLTCWAALLMATILLWTTPW